MQHSDLYVRHIESGFGRLRKAPSMLLFLVRFIQTWKRYNASLQELSQLGDRELADIGINRSDIPRIAWETVHS